MEYIQSLEKIVNCDGSNIKRLLAAVDEVAGIIADDVREIAKHGTDDEIDNRLQLLGSKKNKIYERYLALLQNIKHFKALYEDFSPKTGKVSTKVKSSSEEPEIGSVPTDIGNMFEEVSKRFSSKTVN